MGLKKTFDPSEVRLRARLRSDVNRKFVVQNCEVCINKSVDKCGTMTISKSSGPFSTIISNWLGIPRSVSYPERTRYNASIISAKGIETVLSDENMKRVLIGERNQWPLPLENSRTRQNTINCRTGVLRPWDLVRAVYLYRTIQMEQPGLRRKGVNGRIEKVPPMNSSDVVKAAFALKADDWSGICTGNIDAYRKCGTFKTIFALPCAVYHGGMDFHFLQFTKGILLRTRGREYAVKAMTAHKEGYVDSPDGRISAKGSEFVDVKIARENDNNERNSKMIQFLKWRC